MYSLPKNEISAAIAAGEELARLRAEMEKLHAEIDARDFGEGEK
jgi:hypothetical protein